MGAPGTAGATVEMEPVPDRAWVLRGGDLGGHGRDKNLMDVFEAYSVWGICAKADPDKTHEEIAALGTFGSRRYMAVQAAELRADGYPVVWEPGEPRPACLLLFERGEPDADEWARLRDLMLKNGVFDNPTYRGRQI